MVTLENSYHPGRYLLVACLKCGACVVAVNRGFLARHGRLAGKTRSSGLCRGCEQKQYRSRADIQRKKLSADDLSRIHQRVLAGETQVAVAADYGIAQATISRILRGHRRKKAGLNLTQAICERCGSVFTRYGPARFCTRKCARRARDAREEVRRRTREYMRSRTKNTKDVIEAAKNVPCADCGGTFPPCAMDFDHRNPEEKHHRLKGLIRGRKVLIKKVNIRSLGRKDMLEEIKKCDVVCANCHRIRTMTQRKTGAVRIPRNRVMASASMKRKPEQLKLVG